jgi:hypothetical protein
MRGEWLSPELIAVEQLEQARAGADPDFPAGILQKNSDGVGPPVASGKQSPREVPTMYSPERVSSSVCTDWCGSPSFLP